MNRIMLGDSYKYSHKKQYPGNTVGMFDVAAARSGKIYDKTVFFGLQYILKEYFSTPIQMSDVHEAQMYADLHGIPFDFEGWEYVVRDLGGRLPVKIRAVPEGSIIPTGMPLFTIESTDMKAWWVVSWMETILMKVWYTSNIATRSYNIRKLLEEYAQRTQAQPNVAYQFHNFGDRGSSSVESAAIGGMAHLAVGFMGTDNFNAIRSIRSFYAPKAEWGDDMDDIAEMLRNFVGGIAHSIPASEHSTTTSWSKENEMDMVMNHLEIHKDFPIVAAVADSYDYYKFVETVTGDEKFTSKINSDEYPVFVIRPDSGNPEEVIGRTLDIMEDNDVPYTINTKGYKVWNKYRIIWGDGINDENIAKMLDIFVGRGYSSENIAFGSGGWLMQHHDRDTQSWAIKCTSITLDEGSAVDTGKLKRFDGPDAQETTWEPYYVERDVFKDPITDPGKKSFKGKVTTYFNPTTKVFFVDVPGLEFENYSYDVLETVFENGYISKEYDFNQVRSHNA